SYPLPTERLKVALDHLHIANTVTGLPLEGAENVEILSCTIRNTSSDGIRVLGQSGVFDGRFNDNTIARTGGRGIIVFDLHGGEVRRNMILDPGSGTDGIRLTGSDPAAPAGRANLVEENMVSISGGPSITGIFTDSFSGHNPIAGNVVKGATLRGFFTAGVENELIHNVSAQSVQGFGVSGSRNLLDDNL